MIPPTSTQLPRQHRTTFRLTLLAPTLEHAARQVEGYRTLWKGADRQVTSLSDLAMLPIVHKSHMQSAPDTFRDDSLTTAIVQHTNGSTGPPLFVRRSVPELQFIDKFFRQVRDDEAAAMCITPAADHHGTPTPVPYPGRVLSFNQNDAYWDLSRIATSPWEFFGDDSGPVYLFGLEEQLREYTLRLVGAGYDFDTSAVVGIVSTGNLLTTRLKNWYQSTWRAPMSIRYGLTEVFGGASECGCGFLHFDPLVIPEVVDAFTYEPIETGSGVLVLTCLHPFVQQQPFIRYWTGDLVEVGPTDCPADALSFHLLGRLAASVVRPDPTTTGAAPLVAGDVLFDILDSFPDIATSEVQFGIHGQMRTIVDHRALGPVRATVEHVGDENVDEITITAETRYSAFMYPDAKRELLDRIRAEVFRTHPRLHELVQDNRASLRIATANEGSLRNYRPDTVE